MFHPMNAWRFNKSGHYPWNKICQRLPQYLPEHFWMIVSVDPPDHTFLLLEAAGAASCGYQA